MRHTSRTLRRGGAAVALGAAAAIGSLVMAPAALATNLISVDDLEEGEAGHFIDVQYDACAGSTAPVQVFLNGEDTDGTQYALSTEKLAFQGKQSFLVHAGTYRVWLAGLKSVSTDLGWVDITAADAARTVVRLSTVCRDYADQPTTKPTKKKPTSKPTKKAAPAPTSDPTVKPTVPATVQVPTRIDTGEATTGSPTDVAVLGAGALVVGLAGAAGGAAFTARRRAQRGS